MTTYSLKDEEVFAPEQFLTPFQLGLLKTQPRSLIRSQVEAGIVPPPLRLCERKTFFLFSEFYHSIQVEGWNDRDRAKWTTREVLRERRSILSSILMAVDGSSTETTEFMSLLMRDIHVPRALKAVCVEKRETPTLGTLPVTYHEALDRFDGEHVLGVACFKIGGRWLVDLRDIIKRNILFVDPSLGEGNDRNFRVDQSLAETRFDIRSIDGFDRARFR